MNEQEIKNLYVKFKNDMEIEYPLPNLNVQIENIEQNAQVKSVTRDHAIITVNSNLVNSDFLKEYVDAVLYHEFTHIWDCFEYLTEIRDERGFTYKAFPYNEFHASQIELTKMLNWYSIEDVHTIDKHTKVPYRIKYTSLTNFVTLKFILLTDYIDDINENPSVDKLRDLLFTLVYYIGYLSVLKPYNIAKESDFINLDALPFIKKDVENLSNILLTSLPSEKLCYHSHEIANEILGKLFNYYQL